MVAARRVSHFGWLSRSLYVCAPKVRASSMCPHKRRMVDEVHRRCAFIRPSSAPLPLSRCRSAPATSIVGLTRLDEPFNSNNQRYALSFLSLSSSLTQVRLSCWPLFMT